MIDFSQTPITILLLGLNIVVSLYALFVDQRAIDRLSFKPRKILQDKEYDRLLTAGFVHGGIGHLAFNMITLFYFGPPMEVLLGPIKFLLLYLGAELTAHGLTMLFQRDNPAYAAVGASGAISGVLFGFSLFYPLEKIYLFFIPIGIPAFLFAIGYVVLSIYAMKQSQANDQVGGIAHEAHLGGALGGLVLTILLEPRALGIFLGQLGL